MYCPFYFCNHLAEEEGFSLCFCYHVAVSALCLFLAVPWVGLRLWRFLVILMLFLFGIKGPEFNWHRGV